MEGPFIRIEDTGEVVPLRPEITTIGRGRGVDVRLTDPSVSRLHAEFIRRGPYLYVVDLGLSRNGTRVNGVRVDTAVNGLRLTGIEFDTKTLRVIAEANGTVKIAVTQLPRM